MCDRNEALSILDEAVERCSKVLPIRDAYLYGSYARGDYRPYSDVDIMLISSLGEKEISSKSWQVSEIVGDMCIDHDVTISVTVRSQEQFKRQALPYYRNIAAEGIRYKAGRTGYA
ncbi:MAG: nucleotidyltransferase domain-containing protein [Clostridia bacterium]|nr:nucleotidyltransferase domain-containing protein [Clostridia bacterium]